MKKYIVTGGTGFIGSNIVEHISKNPKNTVLVWTITSEVMKKIKKENIF